MFRPLQEVITEIIAYYGAIIENSEKECVEFIAPQNLITTLNIPEYGRLCFDYNTVGKDTVLASYDSDLFKSIGKLFLKKRKILTVIHPPFIPNIDKTKKLIPHKINFLNATFRLTGHKISPATYTLVFLKYLALSDEKQEGVFSVLINEHTLSTTALDEKLISVMDNFEGTKEGSSPDKEKILKILQLSHTVAAEVVRKNLSDFVKSLERRLNRDTNRVYEYYGALKEEATKFIAKKLLSGEYSFKNGEEVKINAKGKILNLQNHITDKSLTGKGIEKLYNKLNAVSTEQKWKINDLVSKYSLKIDIEPVAMIRIETQALQFLINIKRRVNSRQFSITYNPLIKRLDPLPCESCFSPEGTYYICDDYLHIICSKCFRTRTRRSRAGY